MIYLASPYTHSDPAVREARYLAAHRYATDRMADGDIIFSPIVYGHEFAQTNSAAITYDYWMEFNSHMIAGCDYIIVLMLEGWKESAGIQAEIALADLLEKPVRYAHASL